MGATHEGRAARRRESREDESEEELPYSWRDKPEEREALELWETSICHVDRRNQSGSGHNMDIRHSRSRRRKCKTKTRGKTSQPSPSHDRKEGAADGGTTYEEQVLKRRVGPIRCVMSFMPRAVTYM